MKRIAHPASSPPPRSRPAPPAGRGAPRRQKNIVQTAVAAGQFKTLASLLTKAGLAGDAAGQGPVHGLRPDRRGLRQGAEGDARGARQEQGEAPGRAPLPRRQGQGHGGPGVKLRSAKTLNGKPRRDPRQRRQGLVGGATVTKADVMASNGVIHVINKVLIPRTGAAAGRPARTPRRAADEEVQPMEIQADVRDSRLRRSRCARRLSRAAPLERRDGRPPLRAGARDARARKRVLAAGHELVPAA